MLGNKKLRLLTTFVLSLFGTLLFPSVTNFTPAYATQPNNPSLSTADSLLVVVNKQRPLNPIDYAPAHMLAPTVSGLNMNPYGRKLRKEAALAAEALAQAMHDSGVGNLIIQSGYRSYAEQTSVHSRQVSRYGMKVGEALAARPGYSEHQTGLAMDVSARGQGCQIRVCFGQTKAGRWLATNAYKYGFIVRYPNHSTPITGYQYEPWHLRYIGVDDATDMNAKGIHILETYFHLPPAPKY